MAFIPSRKTRAVLNAFRITAASNSVAANTSTRLGRSTTIESPAASFTPGKTETMVTFDGYCDDADAASVASDWAALTNQADSVATIGFAGITDGARVIFGKGVPSSLSINAVPDESIENQHQVKLQGGGNRGFAGLDPEVPFSATQNATSIDNAVQTTGGYALAAHITAATAGGQVTFRMQHSPDNATWVDLGTVVITDEGQGFIGDTTSTVGRYTRLVADVTVAGTFSASVAGARL